MDEQENEPGATDAAPPPPPPPPNVGASRAERRNEALAAVAAVRSHKPAGVGGGRVASELPPPAAAKPAAAAPTLAPAPTPAPKAAVAAGPAAAARPLAPIPPPKAAEPRRASPAVRSADEAWLEVGIAGDAPMTLRFGTVGERDVCRKMLIAHGPMKKSTTAVTLDGEVDIFSATYCRVRPVEA